MLDEKRIPVVAFFSDTEEEKRIFREVSSMIRTSTKDFFLDSLDEIVGNIETGTVDLVIMHSNANFDKPRLEAYSGKVSFVMITDQTNTKVYDDFIETPNVYVVGLDSPENYIRILPYYIDRALLYKYDAGFGWNVLQVIDQSPAIVAITDLEGNLEYVNPKFTEVTGYSFDEVIGRNPSVLKSGTFDEKVYSELWERIVSGKEWTGDIQNKRKDGSLYWEKALITPIKSSSGAVNSYLKIAEDITAQREAEEKLKISEERYRSVIDNVNMGIAIIDRDMRVLTVNKQMQQWFPQIDVDENPTCYTVLSAMPQESMCPHCPTFQSFKDGQVHEAVIDAVISGRVVTYRLVSCPIRDEAGIVASVAELVEDITDQRKAHLKLKKAFEIQSEFTAMVSHELRTPLTAIKESIAIVYDGITGEINDEQREFLGLAKTNVDRLSRLINEVLDFQKLEAGKVPFNMQLQNIASVIKGVEEIMVPIVRDKDLDLLLDIDRCPRVVVFDSDRIIQVLTNLVNNAVKFTDKGSITIGAYRVEDKILISVKDTGIGIKEEDMPRLFKKFEQLSKGHGRQTGGTGLGLAISYQIVKQHNGQLWAESEYGKGTTFYFTLPYVENQEMWLHDKVDTYLHMQVAEGVVRRRTGTVVIINFNAAQSIVNKEAIVDFVETINSCLARSDDIVFNVESAECLVFLPNASRKDAMQLCLKIRSEAGTGLVVPGIKGNPIKMNFGFASFDDDGVNAASLFDSARAMLDRIKKVVVIDDDRLAVNMVVERIEKLESYECQGVLDGKEGIEKALEIVPDLIVLDLFMPGMNGYEVLGRLKENEITRDIPVVLLTGSEVGPQVGEALRPGGVELFAKTQSGIDSMIRYIADMII